MLIPVVLAFALMFPDLDSPPKYKAWIADHEVWMETSTAPRRVIYDALSAEPVAASPSGDRIVYAVVNASFDAVHCGNTPQKFVVLANASGEFQWKTALEEACNDFSKFEWIDDHRIGVMLCGHANCFYWVLDADSGKVLQKMMGGFDFLWSHDRKWVAHDRPRMTDDDAGTLMFNNDEVVYPLADPKTHLLPSRDIGALTWSPDDKWVSFAETEYPSYDGYVVLVGPHGDLLRESLPVDVEHNARVEWTDVSHFQITTSNRTFKFVLDGGALHEITDEQP